MHILDNYHLKLSLLHDEVDIILVLKILVELDHIRMILHEKHMSIKISHQRNVVSLKANTYEVLQNLDLCAKSVEILNFDPGNCLDGSFLSGNLMPSHVNHTIGTASQFLYVVN